MNVSEQKTIRVIIFAAICAILGYGTRQAFAFDAEIEIGKYNLASIEEYYHLKGVVPNQARHYVDECIAAVASGRDSYYEADMWLDEDTEDITAASLTTPAGKTWRLVKDGPTSFELDNYKLYFSLSELSKNFPLGEYTLTVTLADHTIITRKTTLSNYDDFPDFVDGSVTAVAGEPIKVNWSTVEGADEYEVYGEDFSDVDVYQSGNIYLSYPQAYYSELTGTIVGEDDYRALVEAEKDVTSGDFHIEFRSGREWYVFKKPLLNYDLSGEYWFGSLYADADTWEPWAKSGTVAIDGSNWDQEWDDYDGHHSLSDTFTTTPQVDHSLNINFSDSTYNVAWNGNMIIHADSSPDADNLLGTDIMVRRAMNVDVNNFIGNYSFFGHWLGWNSRWAEVQWGDARFDADGTVVMTYVSSDGYSDTFTSTWTLDDVNGIVYAAGTSHPALLCKDGILVVFQNIDPDSLGYDIFVKMTDASPTPADISGTYLVRFLETSVFGQPFTCGKGTCIIKPDGTFHVDAWYTTPTGYHDVFDAKYKIGPGNRILFGDNAEGIISPDLGFIFGTEYTVPTNPTEDNWIGGTFLVRVASTTASLLSPIQVTKCTVAAGSKNNSDKISISGLMDATTGDILPANFIKVTIYSEDMVSPCVLTFPINGKTFKKGKFSYSGTDESGAKKSFKYDVKTHKFAFLAGNVNLTGLECPLTMDVEIGDYNESAEIYEETANGKKPIPINLLMGVKNFLRVDKFQVKRGKTSDSLAVKGGFSVENTDDANLAANPFSVTLGSQTFTIPAKSFKEKKGKFTCSKVPVDSPQSGVVAATFDFNKCTFTLTIKNTEITDSGDATFNVTFEGFSENADVFLP